MADLNPVLLIVFVPPLLSPSPSQPFPSPPITPSHLVSFRGRRRDLSRWEPLEWGLRPTPVTPVAPHPWET